MKLSAKKTLLPNGTNDAKIWKLGTKKVGGAQSVVFQEEQSPQSRVRGEWIGMSCGQRRDQSQTDSRWLKHRAPAVSCPPAAVVPSPHDHKLWSPFLCYYATLFLLSHSIYLPVVPCRNLAVQKVPSLTHTTRSFIHQKAIKVGPTNTLPTNEAVFAYYYFVWVLFLQINRVTYY